jgi:hypothetical protein
VIWVGGQDGGFWEDWRVPGVPPPRSFRLYPGGDEWTVNLADGKPLRIIRKAEVVEP